MSIFNYLYDYFYMTNAKIVLINKIDNNNLKYFIQRACNTGYISLLSSIIYLILEVVYRLIQVDIHNVIL